MERAARHSSGCGPTRREPPARATPRGAIDRGARRPRASAAPIRGRRGLAPHLLAVAFAFALGLGALGCPEAPPTRGDPPRADRPPLSSIGAPGARHFDQLPPLEEAMRAALAAAPPRRAAIVAAAGALHASADRILADRPAWVRGGDRTQYEGLLIQLKQRALDLQEAAEDASASAIALERARGRVSATCVQCHALFASPPADAHPASRLEGS